MQKQIGSGPWSWRIELWKFWPGHVIFGSQGDLSLFQEDGENRAGDSHSVPCKKFDGTREIIPFRMDVAASCRSNALNAWWEEQRTVINPKCSLMGMPFRRRLGSSPVTMYRTAIGESLKEAQAAGAVSTVDEAKAFSLIALQTAGEGD